MSNGTILICPFAQALRNGKESPKNFPYWPELVKRLLDSGTNVIQVGSQKDKIIPIVKGVGEDHDNWGRQEFLQNCSFTDIREFIHNTDTWISVDTFLPHLNHFYDRKPGIVIFGQSDPHIFGYKENVNLLKSRHYLRDKQFWLWEQAEYKKAAFVDVDVVYKAVQGIINPSEPK